MDAEVAGAAVSKPGSTLCGAPLMKVVVLSSLVGSFGLLGAIVGLHFSGHLGSSQEQRAEATSAGAMVSGANSVNQPGQKKTGGAMDNAVAVAALANSDAADALDDAIQNVADVIDKAAADVDLPDGPSMNTDLDIGGSFGGDSLSDSAGDALSNLADSSEGLGGDLSMEDLSDGMTGGLSDALGDSAEGLGDMGGGFGDSSDSMEILGGDGLEGFGDGMGDFGEGFDDMSDGLGAGMVMSAMMNNNNNNNVNRPRQRSSQQQQIVNPLGILVLTDGMDFKKR